VEIIFSVFKIGPNEVSIFIEDDLNSSYLLLNPEIAKRYFQSDLITVKGERDLFLKVKDDNTIRIVVQGASSVQGFPYGNSISAPRLLKASLKEIYPDKNIEVINLGITAVSSYVLRDMAKEIAKISPDAVIIYSGHNEFYGVYGSSSSQFATAKRSITNAFLYLKKFRIFRWLITLISSGDTEEFDPNKTLMEKMALNQMVPYNSSLFEETKENYSKNITDIIDIYSRSSTTVILSNLAFNLKHQPPFLSAPLPYLGLKDLLFEGKGFDEKETHHQKLKSYLAENPENALLHYLIAQEYYDQQNYESALIHFLASHKYDQLRFRAPFEFNEELEKIAKEKGIYFLDLYSAFAEYSENEIIGNELILEHVHPNVLGYNFMAWNFLQSIINSNSIPPPNTNQDLSFNLIQEGTSLYFNSLDSIRGQVTINALLNNWPFNLYDSIFPPIEIEYQPSFELDLSLDIISSRISHYNASLLLCEKYLKSGEFGSLLRVANSLDLEWVNRPRVKIYQIFALLQLSELERAQLLIIDIQDRFGKDFLLEEISKLLVMNDMNRESILTILK